jgi:hypothetical protein
VPRCARQGIEPSRLRKLTSWALVPWSQSLMHFRHLWLHAKCVVSWQILIVNLVIAFRACALESGGLKAPVTHA